MSCSYYTFRQGDFYCTKKGDYVNSDVYYKYCRNYDYDDCPIYKNQSSSGCYLTTACVLAKDLPDDCYELQTLRIYRDNWLRNQKDGENLVKKYYEIAPKIVERINASDMCKATYEMIFNRMVKPCVELIEAGKNEEARDLYQSITEKLEKEFC